MNFLTISDGAEVCMDHEPALVPLVPVQVQPISATPPSSPESIAAENTAAENEMPPNQNAESERRNDEWIIKKQLYYYHSSITNCSIARVGSRFSNEYFKVLKFSRSFLEESKISLHSLPQKVAFHDFKETI